MLFSHRLLQCPQSWCLDHWIYFDCHWSSFIHLTFSPFLHWRELTPHPYLWSSLILSSLTHLKCSYWVYLTHLVHLVISWPFGASDLHTHCSFHLILYQLLFLFGCFWFCCCLIPSSGMGTNGLYVWSCFNCSNSLGMWPILSLVLPMQSLCLHLFYQFIHQFHYLCCTYCTTNPFLPPGPQSTDWTPFTYEKYWYLACTSSGTQW